MFDSDKAEAAWAVRPVWTAGPSFTCCGVGNFVLCFMATLLSSSVRLRDFALEETGIEIPEDLLLAQVLQCSYCLPPFL